MSLTAFTPNTSVTTTVTTAQSNISVLGNGHYLRLVNNGPGNAWVRFYEPPSTPPTVAAATSMLVPAGAIEIFSVASDVTRAAVICDTTTAVLNITRGEGT